MRLTLDKISFAIHADSPHWSFVAPLDGPITNGDAVKGRDGLGAFEEVRFTTVGKESYERRIRVYDRKPVVLFFQKTVDSISHPPKPFPVVSRFPSSLSALTFSENEFGAPPLFRPFDHSRDTSLRLHSGPILLFDPECNACIISPASDFMVASIAENGAVVSCGLNPALIGVPRGFTQSTILVIGRSINQTWDLWGSALTTLYRKKRPANDADAGLKYLGYWTDNGASYYYHYDTAEGYAGTLLALKKRFDEEKIPIRTMQLDSWWYAKGRDNPDGSLDRSERRIPELPAGTWNHFGGLLEYTPSTDLFPSGLKSFRDSVNLPLITHNRWISRDSPYRLQYRISGIGSVDPGWWTHIMSSISSWGIVTYEQDWLDRIYENSPAFSSTTWAAASFMDEMARAARERGVTLQYCMALPRHYLQGGAEYSDLTTIRVSGDRFQKSRWKEFLYASRLASALGIWPWTDVFMSRETPNILLATLSAGMVGIGDAAGDENVRNIMRSVRSDGVIVKPDVPLVPVDRSYIDDAAGKGARIATTFTDHGKGVRTLYLFAYSDSSAGSEIVVRPSDLGVHSAMFSYDYFSGSGKIVRAGESLNLRLNDESYIYVVLAPVSRSGIAVIGDPDQFVTCGRARVARLTGRGGVVQVILLITPGEHDLTLRGSAPAMPAVAVQGGRVTSTEFEIGSSIFSIGITRESDIKFRSVKGDSVGEISVELRASS